MNRQWQRGAKAETSFLVVPALAVVACLYAGLWARETIMRAEMIVEELDI